MLASPGVLEQQGEEEPRVISQSRGGRAGGERSRARAAAAVRPTALPPAPARAQASPGGRVPAHRTRARPFCGDRGSAARHSAVSYRRVARTTVPGARTRQPGVPGADVPSGAHGFREGHLATCILPRSKNTHPHLNSSLRPQGSTQETSLRKGQLGCTSPCRGLL